MGLGVYLLGCLIPHEDEDAAPDPGAIVAVVIFWPVALLFLGLYLLGRVLTKAGTILEAEAANARRRRVERGH